MHIQCLPSSTTAVSAIDIATPTEKAEDRLELTVSRRRGQSRKIVAAAATWAALPAAAAQTFFIDPATQVVGEMIGCPTSMSEVWPPVQSACNLSALTAGNATALHPIDPIYTNNPADETWCTVRAYVSDVASSTASCVGGAIQGVMDAYSESNASGDRTMGIILGCIFGGSLVLVGGGFAVGWAVYRCVQKRRATIAANELPTHVRVADLQ